MVLTSSAIEGRRHFQILSFQTNCLTSVSIALREDPLPQSLGVAGKEYFNNFVVNPPFRDHFHRKTGKQLPSLDVSSDIDYIIIGWNEITSELVLLKWCQKRAIAVLTLLTPLHLAASDYFPNAGRCKGVDRANSVRTWFFFLNNHMISMNVFPAQSFTKECATWSVSYRNP